LQQKRYGEHLNLEIDVNAEEKNKKIPPMVLQILTENAIKHNAISHETPLKIIIHAEGNKLEIKNNLNLKINELPSTKTGLLNVINRFKLITKEPVVITKTGISFSVIIPLI
jgi:LytS/YehU family sensor histidine kinase